MTEPAHVPVMLERVLTLLGPVLERPGAVFCDATLGLGGHAEAVLQRFDTARVIGIDRDPDALERAATRLAPYADRLTTVHATYDDIADAARKGGVDHIDAALFDLGVSSMQLDVAERGFAYSQDAPLDMRMDTTAGLTAADVVNTYEERELIRILREYGEERFAPRIVRAIVAARPVTSSATLAQIVKDAIPAAARRTGGNPAKRSFQALRIEVNDELAVLRRALPAALDHLTVGGRMVVLSYHSLEDRMVKRQFADVTTITAPPGLPVIPDSMKPRFSLLTRGAEQASPDEIDDNRRAKPVRLRAIERIAA